MTRSCTAALSQCILDSRRLRLRLQFMPRLPRLPSAASAIIVHEWDGSGIRDQGSGSWVIPLNETTSRCTAARPCTASQAALPCRLPYRLHWSLAGYHYPLRACRQTGLRLSLIGKGASFCGPAYRLNKLGRIRRRLRQCWQIGLNHFPPIGLNQV